MNVDGDLDSLLDLVAVPGSALLSLCQWDGHCPCLLGHGVPPLVSSRPSLLPDELLPPVQ